MAFAVVHFLETDDVYPVSKLWLEGESKCRFPSESDASSIKRSILQHEHPKQNWQTHEVVVLGYYGLNFFIFLHFLVNSNLNVEKHY